MQTFKYKSMTRQGESRSGVLTAVDRGDAIRQLLNRGETATSIIAAGDRKAAKRKQKTAPSVSAAASKQKTQSSGLSLSFGGKPTLSGAEMATFIRELATALEAGLPLMQALRTMRKQAYGKAMPAILDHLIERVEAGDPLWSAARDYGAPFNDMTVGMLRAADASGDMAKVMHQLADLMERSLELKREVVGATTYPAILAVLVLASAIILVTIVVPRLIEPLAGNMELPWPTKVVMSTADFIGSFWFILIAAVILTVLGVRAWISNDANRLLLDRFKLRVPVLGPLLRDVAVARFTRTLGTLASAGLPILDSLRITQGTLGNRAMMSAIDDVKEQVTAGRPLADPLDRSGLFPPLLVQVVSLGERSGRLETMLLHSAAAFDRKVNQSLKMFTKFLPPVLLVFLACGGGFILAAILLPLLELQSMVG